MPVSAPMCPICNHAHWLKDGHIWPVEKKKAAKTPAPPLAPKAPAKKAPAKKAKAKKR